MHLDPPAEAISGDIGCRVAFQNNAKEQVVAIVNKSSSGDLNAKLTSGPKGSTTSSFQQILFVGAASHGWMKVRAVMDPSPPTPSFLFEAVDENSATVKASTTHDLPVNVSSVEIRCGIAYASVSGDASAATLNVRVDNIVVKRCAP